MAEIHVATAGDLTRALAQDAYDEVRQWADLITDDPGCTDDVRMALASVMDDVLDHVQIRFAATLATFGISADQLAAYERALIDAGLDHFDFDGSYRGDDYEPDYEFSVNAARRACEMPEQEPPS